MKACAVAQAFQFSCRFVARRNTNAHGTPQAENAALPAKAALLRVIYFGSTGAFEAGGGGGVLLLSRRRVAADR